MCPWLQSGAGLRAGTRSLQPLLLLLLHPSYRTRLRLPCDHCPSCWSPPAPQETFCYLQDEAKSPVRLKIPSDWTVFGGHPRQVERDPCQPAGRLTARAAGSCQALRRDPWAPSTSHRMRREARGPQRCHSAPHLDDPTNGATSELPVMLAHCGGCPEHHPLHVPSPASRTGHGAAGGRRG